MRTSRLVLPAALMMLSFMSLSLVPSKNPVKLKDFGAQKEAVAMKEFAPRWLAKDSCASLTLALNVKKHALVGVLDPRADEGSGQGCVEHPVAWCVNPGGETGMFLPPTPEVKSWTGGALLAVARADGASVFRVEEIDGVCARVLGEGWRHAAYAEGAQWAFVP